MVIFDQSLKEDVLDGFEFSDDSMKKLVTQHIIQLFEIDSLDQRAVSKKVSS